MMIVVLAIFYKQIPPIGGIGAELNGGNFWQGAVIGGVVAGLNHVAHSRDSGAATSDDGNGDCPTCPKNAKEGDLYMPKGAKYLFESYVYRDGEWVTFFEASAVYGDVPIGQGGAFKGIKALLSKDAIKSVNSYKDLIIKHQSKLTKYILNPDNYDNLNLLKNAPNQLIRNKIIQSRIQHLKHEIKTFHQNMNNILNGK